MSETTTTVAVEGMTCGHCALSVREAVEPLAGVTDVRVSVKSGTMTVTTEGPVDHDALAAAVTEAGYAVTP